MTDPVGQIVHHTAGWDCYFCGKPLEERKRVNYPDGSILILCEECYDLMTNIDGLYKILEQGLNDKRSIVSEMVIEEMRRAAGKDTDGTEDDDDRPAGGGD
jgi:ribosome-binding protein aMBF1 (putative translation factor)